MPHTLLDNAGFVMKNVVEGISAEGGWRLPHAWPDWKTRNGQRALRGGIHDLPEETRS